jgi:hypothetical protein
MFDGKRDEVCSVAFQREHLSTSGKDQIQQETMKTFASKNICIVVLVIC